MNINFDMPCYGVEGGQCWAKFGRFCEKTPRGVLLFRQSGSTHREPVQKILEWAQEAIVEGTISTEKKDILTAIDSRDVHPNVKAIRKQQVEDSDIVGVII